MSHIAIPDDSKHQLHRGITNRITFAERSAAEQSARAIQRLAALGEMTGGIAPDFRNLLAIIDSDLRLAKNNSEQPEKVRSCIAAAQEGINRGVKLVSQLLTFVMQRELEARVGDANELLRGRFEIGCQACTSSSSALASFRSSVSKPSLNQP